MRLLCQSISFSWGFKPYSTTQHVGSPLNMCFQVCKCIRFIQEALHQVVQIDKSVPSQQRHAKRGP